MTDSNTIIDSANTTILVVDDTPANLNLLNQCLKKRGYQTRCAVSGKVALDYLASHRPDIILLDILQGLKPWRGGNIPSEVWFLQVGLSRA
ncbi:MAG: response regulator [Cyanobacteria bacterium J06648_11]